MEFSQGKATGKIKKIGPARGSGTTIFFHPDASIFPRTEFNPETIRERLEVASYVHKGLKVLWNDEVGGKREVFHHDDGILAFLRKILIDKSAKPVHEQPFVFEKSNGIRIETCFSWTESTEELLKSYVNGIPTGNGGTHENGLRAGVAKAIRNYIETHNLTPRGVTLAVEDIREGVIGVLSVFIEDPQFQGQTKDRLNNPEIQSQIDSAIRPALGAMAEHEHERRRDDRESHHHRGPRARGVVAPRALRSHAKRRPADGSRCPANSPIAAATIAPRASSSSSRATAPAAARSRAATATSRRSSRSAARC